PFFILTRGRPTCPLFPYTTLFRSWMTVRPGSPRFMAGVDIPKSEKAEIVPWLWCQGKSAAEEKMTEYLKERVKARSDELLFQPGDRKSTRLNSSHRTISYAVFCLK